jgi:hypothetical protein
MDYYTKDDKGEFVKVEGELKPIDEFNKVYNALQSERKIRADFEKKSKAFGDMTPDQVTTLQHEVEELKALGGGDTEKIKAELTSLYERKIDAIKADASKAKQGYEKDISDRDGVINSFHRDRLLRKEIAEFADPDKTGDIMALLQGQLEYDPAAERLKSPDGVTEVGSVVKAFFDERPHFVKTSAGAGAKGGTTVAGGKKFKEMTMTEQSKYIKEHPEEYEKLKSAVNA